MYIKEFNKGTREGENYRQGWPEWNEVALEDANANGQNHIVSLVDGTILRCHYNAVSRVLYLPYNLPQNHQ